MLSERAVAYHLFPRDRNPRETMSSEENRTETQDNILSFVCSYFRFGRAPAESAILRKELGEQNDVNNKSLRLVSGSYKRCHCEMHSPL